MFLNINFRKCNALFWGGQDLSTKCFIEIAKYGDYSAIEPLFKGF